MCDRPRQPKRGTLFFFLLCLAVATGCRQPSRYDKHNSLGLNSIPLPPVAVTLPAPDTACDLLHPTRDSTSITWLRSQPIAHYSELSERMMVHIYSAGGRYFFATYYPQANGLFNPAKVYTTVPEIDTTSRDTIAVTAWANRYYYVVATHRWYDRTFHDQMPQVPSLKAVNEYLAHYYSKVKASDTNTLARFGSVIMHRIYHYGDRWLLADYSALSADVHLMRRSDHPRGQRFDYENTDEQRGVYDLTDRPFRPRGATADEDFRRRISYYVVGRDSVFCYSLGTDSLRYAMKRQKEWRYHYSYYDSVFYAGPRWVDSVYKL